MNLKLLLVSGVMLTQIAFADETISMDSLQMKELETLFTKANAPGSNLKIFMRHGGQTVSPKCQEQKDAATKKICMMRLPDNQNNQATSSSIKQAEALSTFINKLIQKNTLELKVYSSSNARAKNVGQVIGGRFMTIDSRLNCINYPAEKNVSTTELLKLLPEGSIPWENKIIDQVTTNGTYEKISTYMKRILDQSPIRKNSISIYITHSQQLAAIQKELNLPIKRLNTLSFIAVLKTKTKKRKVHVLDLFNP